MWFKPPIFFVIAALLLFVYGSYYSYQLWFNPRKMVDSERERIRKLPKWYPFREFFLGKYEYNDGWISQSKIMAIGMELFCILYLTLVLTAWFIGN